MSQTVLAAGGDDNPRDEMKSFGDEGDEAEAAEHLDDELGLKQELENGDDRLVRAMPADMSAVGVSYRSGMPMLYPCPPYHATNMEPPSSARMPLRPPPLTAQPQSVVASTSYEHGQSWVPRGQTVPLSGGQYMPSMNSGLPRLQHHPQPRFYGQYPMQQGGMHGQMGMMMPYQQQFQQGGMVMQQAGYPPQVVQHQQGAGMIPMSPSDNMTPGPHVKKPLNAFMLYMKEMRQHVVKECTLKESAAINQILGRKWHALDRSEQAKYYEMARRERALHQQLFPGWSARDNYAIAKKKKKKRDKSQTDAAALKKCRARYGLDQQQKWCKPCRRKKKCIRFTQLGDCASGDEGQGVVDEPVTTVEETKVDVVQTNGNAVEEDSELGKPVVEEPAVEAENQTVDILVLKEE